MGRIFLFCYNLVFIVFAVIVLTIATLIQFTYYQLSEIKQVQDVFLSVPLLLIILSLVIILIATLGLCVSVTSNNFLIFLYCLCMFSIFATEIAFGLFLSSHKNFIRSYIGDIFQDSLYKYTNETKTQKTIDVIQYDFECCGLRNYTDWYKVMERNLPKSCCTDSKFDQDCSLNSNNYRTVGCLKSIEDYLSQNYTTVSYIFLIILILQVTFCLARISHTVFAMVNRAERSDYLIETNL